MSLTLHTPQKLEPKQAAVKHGACNDASAAMELPAIVQQTHSETRYETAQQSRGRRELRSWNSRRSPNEPRLLGSDLDRGGVRQPLTERL